MGQVLLPKPERDETRIPEGVGWHLSELFEREKRVIQRWLVQEGNADLNRYTGAVPDSEADSAVSEIASSYATHRGPQPLDLLGEYQNIVDRAPSKGEIWLFAVLLVLSGGAEIAVGVVTWLLASSSGEGTAAVLVVAILLLAAGWLLGHGLAGYFMLAKAEDDEITQEQKSSHRRGKWFKLALAATGAAFIAALSALRAGVFSSAPVALSGQMQVVVLTTILSVLVALFEMLRSMASEKRARARREAFRCQVHNAIEQHRDNLSQYRDFYRSHVTDLRKQGHSNMASLGREQAAPPPAAG